MKIQLFSNIETLSISKDTWNYLAERNEINTPFQTYEWFQSWWRVFGEMHELFLLVVYEGNEVIGLAPLMLSQKSQKKRVVTFIGDKNADYCDFIISNRKPDVLKAIVDYLVQNCGTRDRIFLRNIPEDSTTLPVLKRICAGYNLKLLEDSTICPTLILNDTAQAKCRTTSRTLRRHINYFEKNGKLSFKIFDSYEVAKESLDIFFAQHIRRWSSTKQLSLFLDENYKRFYKELLEQTWKTGWLFFSCLEFNQQQIAFHFGFDYNSKVIWYKPSFDIGFRKHSPGSVMLKYLIEYCIDNNKDEFDFTLGDEPFKQKYANVIRMNNNIQIFKNKTDYFYEASKKSSQHIIKAVLGRLLNKQ